MKALKKILSIPLSLAKKLLKLPLGAAKKLLKLPLGAAKKLPKLALSTVKKLLPLPFAAGKKLFGLLRGKKKTCACADEGKEKCKCAGAAKKLGVLGLVAFLVVCAAKSLTALQKAKRG